MAVRTSDPEDDQCHHDALIISWPGSPFEYLACRICGTVLSISPPPSTSGSHAATS